MTERSFMREQSKLLKLMTFYKSTELFLIYTDNILRYYLEKRSFMWTPPRPSPIILSFYNLEIKFPAMTELLKLRDVLTVSSRNIEFPKDIVVKL